MLALLFTLCLSFCEVFGVPVQHWNHHGNKHYSLSNIGNLPVIELVQFPGIMDERIRNNWEASPCDFSNTTLVAGNLKQRSAITDCRFDIEYDFVENRIPQRLFHVRCLDSNSGNHHLPIRHRRRKTQCEEVTYQMSVLKKGINPYKPDAYHPVWENVTVACIRTMPPSLLQSKLGNTITIEMASK